MFDFQAERFKECINCIQNLQKDLRHGKIQAKFDFGEQRNFD